MCIAGLAIALCVSQVKNAALNNDIQRLQKSLGLVDYSPDKDEYKLSDTGDDTVSECLGSPTYLLRVENYEKYLIEVTHYSGNRSKVMKFDIADPIVAISFFPTGQPNNLFIRSTVAHDLNTFHSVKLNVGTLIKHSKYDVNGSQIGDNIILSLFFGPEGFQIPFGSQEFDWQQPITASKMKRLCDACNIESVTFRLVKRSD